MPRSLLDILKVKEMRLLSPYPALLQSITKIIKNDVPSEVKRSQLKDLFDAQDIATLTNEKIRTEITYTTLGSFNESTDKFSLPDNTEQMNLNLLQYLLLKLGLDGMELIDPISPNPSIADQEEEQLLYQDAIKLLLRKGFDVNHGKQFTLPITLAIFTMNFRLVFELIQFGADITQVNSDEGIIQTSPDFIGKLAFKLFADKERSLDYYERNLLANSRVACFLSCLLFRARKPFIELPTVLTLSGTAEKFYSDAEITRYFKQVVIRAVLIFKDSSEQEEKSSDALNSNTVLEALSYAASLGDVKSVKAILQRYPDLNVDAAATYTKRGLHFGVAWQLNEKALAANLFLGFLLKVTQYLVIATVVSVLIACLPLLTVEALTAIEISSSLFFAVVGSLTATITVGFTARFYQKHNHPANEIELPTENEPVFKLACNG